MCEKNVFRLFRSSASGKPHLLVRYLPDKGLITPKLYVEDAFNDSVIIESDDQEFDDTPLYIPNIKNYDNRNGRRKSNIVVLVLIIHLLEKL